MRYKIVPEPVDCDVLVAAHAALPLVPDSVEDCCIRMVDRTAVPSRDAAREWVTFLQALELAERTPGGFKRVRTDPEEAALADAFRRRVFGVEELLSAVAASGPLSAEDAFEGLRPAVPAWERDRYPDWEREWRERTRRLLAWAEQFGLVASEDGGYTAVGTS